MTEQSLYTLPPSSGPSSYLPAVGRDDPDVIRRDAHATCRQQLVHVRLDLRKCDGGSHLIS